MGMETFAPAFWVPVVLLVDCKRIGVGVDVIFFDTDDGKDWREKTMLRKAEPQRKMKSLQLSAGKTRGNTHLSLPMNQTLKSWLPVLLWMLVIFIMSTDAGSAAHTSRFIDPFLRWLVPGISLGGIARAHFLIRKMGHLTEYAILGILLWRAWTRTMSDAGQQWQWKTAIFALALAAAYAASDEFHQSFVPSRGASVQDVAIDSCGAFLGLMVLRACKMRRQPAPARTL